MKAYSARAELDERGRGRERGRDRREKHRDQEDGCLSRQTSATSLYSQGSSEHHTGKRKSAKERVLSEPAPMQGWMSKLETDGKWRKHWFVLDDVALKYYRDLEAEESDDPEGEIELMTCVNVSDCEVEKNHGFQIQTKRAVFTLSATTSRIRRNWVKLLKQAIQQHTQ
ncbi:myosin phosphatase Rho-interacting protein-like [Gadus macrocephalus]|uniref:myosin phosphatase Rho-interacting protein-like n=1 Tax=Gadus macrocephalus TaxID=80720 RepID=UPI0028CB2700|nr:myosin phosphatase Rho-interacting protein-like [Gadus macrocephalus]